MKRLLIADEQLIDMLDDDVRQHPTASLFLANDPLARERMRLPRRGGQVWRARS
jgi:hypothetical protein